MATRLAIFALFNCVVATPLKSYDSNENKPISNLQLLIPMPLVEGSRGPGRVPRAPPGDSGEYWQPNELPADGPFSQIPADAFTLDETARYLTEELAEPPKKTVKKDLSRLEETRTPRVRLLDVLEPAPVDEDSDTDIDYRMERCQQVLKLLAKTTDPRASSRLRPSELRSLCLLHMKYNSRSDSNVFRTYKNVNKVLKSKRPSSATGFLASLLGGDRPSEGEVAESMLDVSGNNWKGQLGNLGINGHGGYAGNLGVGGKGRDVGNLAVGGKGGQYGNLGIGGQGALFGNLGIGGGGGAYEEPYFPKDSWTNQYQNGLLSFLLGDGGHSGSMFSSGHEAKDIPKVNHPDVDVQDFPETNSVPDDTLVPPEKELDNLDTDHKGNFYSKFDKNGYGRVLGSSILHPQSAGPAEDDKDTPKESQARDPTLRDKKSILRELCGKNDNRCGSLLLGGTGGLIGNLAIDGFESARWAGSPGSPQPPVRLFALALVGGAGGGERAVLLKELKYPSSGRRDWTSIGNDHNQMLRQYIDKNKPWLVL